MAALGWALTGAGSNLVLEGTATADDPPGDGIFGQLMLIGVGRALIPFFMSLWAWKLMSLWW